jgi:hypothetical protein
VLQNSYEIGFLKKVEKFRINNDVFPLFTSQMITTKVTHFEIGATTFRQRFIDRRMIPNLTVILLAL